MTNPREISAQILYKIYEGLSVERSTLNSKLFLRLDQRDKSFVMLLILNTLRRNGQIDLVISKFAKKPFQKNSLIRNLLRISVSQILFINIPDYPIVNEAVNISKKYGSEKFVNGILRNICRRKKKLLEDTSYNLNVPNWIKKDILKSYGKEYLDSFSKQIIKEPSIDIKIKQTLTTRRWDKILNGKKIFSDLVRIKESKRIEDLPSFKNGDWWVQGLSATLPVVLINNIFTEVDRSKISILDVGSAPGGKTFQLLDSGYEVTSIEISKRRIRRLKENSNRLKLKCNVVNTDFMKFKAKKLFDCILIDAPCSGSGLIQKKPEILVRKKNISSLIEKQRLMLEYATKNVKTGGYIIYAVCSILSEEGKDQIENFLKNNKTFSLYNLFKPIKNFGKEINNLGFITFPFHKAIEGGMDGFFITCLKRNKL